MNNKLFASILAALCWASACGFFTNPNRFATTSTQQHFRLYSSETVSVDATTSSAQETPGQYDMSPEYEAAYQKAMVALKASLQDKPEMLAPLEHFVKEYLTASQKGFTKTNSDACTPDAALKRILEGLQFGFKYGMGPEKYVFGVTHDALRGDPESEDGNTMDFYEWGCDFFRPMIDYENSLVEGKEYIDKAMEQIRAGENVVFLANHQSEADPQVVSYMLEKAGYKKEAEDLVYVAGHKVTTDPLAIPFSMGRNLICIHSKKHIDADPETKSVKSRQNLNAMSGMLNKLKAGGCLLWVAPSGGRDRRDVESGKTPIANFDEKTVDMFRLMGGKSKKPTHFYPMAIVSYELCPPPDFVEAGVGEQRNFRFVPVAIKVGPAVESQPEGQSFSDAAFKQALKDYTEIREQLFPGTAPLL